MAEPREGFRTSDEQVHFQAATAGMAQRDSNLGEDYLDVWIAAREFFTRDQNGEQGSEDDNGPQIGIDPRHYDAEDRRLREKALELAVGLVSQGRIQVVKFDPERPGMEDITYHDPVSLANVLLSFLKGGASS